MSNPAMAAETLAVLPERPDLGWIKTKVPVEDVARELGLEVRHHRARCWRVEKHRNGDDDPSLRFHARKNRARCFVCDQTGGFSNIDLVMGVLDSDFPSAVAWIREHFPVPRAKRGSPIGPRSSWRPNYRVGITGCDLEPLVRFGFWATLTPTQRTVLVVLRAFRDQESGLTQISYRGLMRFAGVGSSKSIARAVWGLHALHALHVHRGQALGVVRGCNLYRLTLDDPEFLRLLNAVYRRQHEEIERERNFAREARLSRKRPHAVSPPPPNPSVLYRRLLSLPREAPSNKPLYQGKARGVKTLRDGGYEPPTHGECLRGAREQ